MTQTIGKSKSATYYLGQRGSSTSYGKPPSTSLNYFGYKFIFKIVYIHLLYTYIEIYWVMASSGATIQH